MRDALGPLGQKWVAEGRPDVSVRMGVNTGRMVVGNMGSTQRVNYTIMGDAVNLASRLEGANKAFKSDLMISEATYAQCADDVDVRELDIIRVVGKEEPIRVYQLLDRKGRTSGALADMVDSYHKGLESLRSGRFEDAVACFETCLTMMPADGPSTIQLARAKRLSEESGDWDGIFTLTEKG
jgi:adenylate cyclase